MSSPRTEDVLRALQEREGSVRVVGAPSGAQAHVLLEAAKESKAPWVVLCADDDAAESLVSDLRAFATDGSIHALLFPGGDPSPYGSLSPSIRNRHHRVTALSALHVREGRIPILVTTPLASSQATLPSGVFADTLLHVKLGSSVGSREDLTQRLTEAGYLRTDPVEDPGTFAVRGDIMDVYPVGRAHPLRIELFGDEIERLREFNAKTQRASTDSLQEATIPPAREVLLTRKNLPELRARIKAHADDRGVSRTIRDPILSALEEGRYPERWDAWAPFAFEPHATLWDHLPPDARVAWIDSMETLRLVDARLNAFREEEKAAEREAALVPPVKTLFGWSASLEKKVEHLTRLHFDAVEMTDLSEEPELPPEEEGKEGESREAPTRRTLRVFVKDNEDIAKLRTPEERFDGAVEAVARWVSEGYRVHVYASSKSRLERVRFLLEGRSLPLSDPPGPGQVALRPASFSGGFRWPSEKLAIITDREILGTGRAPRMGKFTAEDRSGEAGEGTNWAPLVDLSDLAPGDAVVHRDHGIGRYVGLVRLDVSGGASDFIQLEYAGNDKLYVPVYRLNCVQKYHGSGESTALDKLGAKRFEKEKERVREAVRAMAFDLVELYAKRNLQVAPRISVRGPEFGEFEARFPYDETPDQLKAIQDTYSDMESGRLMDRLVCGDVGFGKTEVALRAAFAAAVNGKQVAVLVPTTVLCLQHEETFRARFAGYPLKIASVSRFKARNEQAAVLASLAKGEVDIVVGTHRLLSSDVRFKDLGLVIVDEEHRFGVEHKEKLKTLKLNTHILTLTATPIPRTLHMSLSGLRDISLITTPPMDRLPIRTYVSRFDEVMVRRAMEAELARGGQIYFVHNRVQSIHETAARLRELVPSARFLIGHGQMGERELEKTMVAFYRREADVLVCTTIIESGLDVPSANTILIDRADTYGLAQLYQLRGRVGRSDRRAYAYLLVPSTGGLSDDAKKRLDVIQRFVELGSGFTVASHDLEIRGGGNLIGPEQSGHVAAVGFELYTELLEEAVREIRGRPEQPEDSHREPEIKTPFPAFLSEEFIPDVHQRLSLYRRLSAASSDEAVDGLEEEMRDRFGPPPAQAENLFWIIRIKLLLKKLGVETLTVGKEKVSLQPGPASRIDPAKVVRAIPFSKDIQLTPDQRLVLQTGDVPLRDLRYRLEQLLDPLLSANF